MRKEETATSSPQDLLRLKEKKLFRKKDQKLQAENQVVLGLTDDNHLLFIFLYYAKLIRVFIRNKR